MKIIAASAAIVVAGFSAQAATVAIGGTGSTGAGGFTSDLATTDTNNGAYYQGATTPASNWVWANDPLVEYGQVIFTFAFDLTGFNAASATLSGLWGVDNLGEVFLNGTRVSWLDFGYSAFDSLTAFDGTGATFNAGLNELTFFAINAGGPGAFRASVTVSADPIPAAVPLPAALPLLAGAVAAVGFVARRRKAA
ncbi:MAG: hypothetical protein DI533_09020 [Cereibacter sphaeroides]|uniref:VPLPA-CTERM sorting domain-containing protein n=1 Tax=Cereibacter sphaeroides TaxID=1063 RepID=A0A2W5SM20_CERSP|nr:MAG: hypothetical protein DI533_09020 [Cereibacter sphaeroides]